MTLAITGPWGLADRDGLFAALDAAAAELAVAGTPVELVVTVPGGPLEGIVCKWCRTRAIDHLQVHHTPHASAPRRPAGERSVYAANERAVELADAVLVLAGTLDRPRKDLARRFAAAGKDVYDSDVPHSHGG